MPRPTPSHSCLNVCLGPEWRKRTSPFFCLYYYASIRERIAKILFVTAAIWLRSDFPGKECLQGNLFHRASRSERRGGDAAIATPVMRLAAGTRGVSGFLGRRLQVQRVLARPDALENPLDERGCLLRRVGGGDRHRFAPQHHLDEPALSQLDQIDARALIQVQQEPVLMLVARSGKD